MRRRKGSTSYSRRERDFDFMGFVKQQPCVVHVLPPPFYTSSPRAKATPCSGEVEADHQGAHGLGQKAADDTCVPLCMQHHRERTDHSGTFRSFTRDEARSWRALAIAHTQANWATRETP